MVSAGSLRSVGRCLPLPVGVATGPKFTGHLSTSSHICCLLPDFLSAQHWYSRLLSINDAYGDHVQQQERCKRIHLCGQVTKGQGLESVLYKTYYSQFTPSVK